MGDLRNRPNKEMIEIQKAITRGQRDLSKAVSDFTANLTGKAGTSNPAGFERVELLGDGSEASVAINGNTAILAETADDTVQWRVVDRTLYYTVNPGVAVTFLVFDV